MNQIMINAAEWLAMQDRLDTLKRENEQLKKSLTDANARIKILIEEVGFAERGYTKEQCANLTNVFFTRSSNERLLFVGQGNAGEVCRGKPRRAIGKGSRDRPVKGRSQGCNSSVPPVDARSGD
jgi:hypothetical protein